jgi:hypothetical protein
MAGVTVLLTIVAAVRAVDTATLQRYYDTVCFINTTVSFYQVLNSGVAL